jgi:hypothetical protein
MMTAYLFKEPLLNGPMQPGDSSEERFLREVVRLNSVTTGIAFGMLGGLAVFIATILLVIKGGPQVGPHLMLLANYFPGYRVTFLGSFVGLFYGFVSGFISGCVVGWLYNVIVDFRDR